MRAEKDGGQLECYSFKHNLSVVGEDRKFDSDKIFTNLNFHLCLLIKDREQILTRGNEDLDKISTILVDTGDLFNGKVSFLSAGKDHVHLHIELSPDCAPDKIVRFTKISIKNLLLELFERNEEFFEKTYFIETIG